MKRYDLELTATGPVMEERKEGAFVPFSEVNGLADTAMKMGDRCQLLTDLLREATRVIPAIGVTTDDMPVVDAFLERIEDAVSGEDSHQTGITLSAADLVELADFCSPDRDTDPEQLETEIVLFYRHAFKSTDGDDMPAGVYVHLADYPEEGVYDPVGGRRLVGKQQKPALPQLSHEEHAALARFQQCCEDGQGYDVDKDMMTKLARKGALHHRSAGYYEVTETGCAMLAAVPKPQGGDPCDIASQLSSPD
ncbi:hypothetical protein [Aeromonas caviae]|uniref:hypothetical protein n=1 Tax=Aeromonas caviae TaxID=648 RepID=UPI002B4617A4|nr:hypothetical protein [Aeromonas caviae]